MKHQVTTGTRYKLAIIHHQNSGQEVLIVIILHILVRCQVCDTNVWDVPLETLLILLISYTEDACKPEYSAFSCSSIHT